ncbi:MAG: prepilin peptidase [Eubacterium sp.]|nr:prepilin peptidase [Eubacterium sp.]
METIQIIIQTIIVLYLVVMAVIDVQKKEIPLLPGAICFGITVVTLLVAGCDFMPILTGVMVGGLLFVISLVSRGGIGQADALVYAITGASLGFFKNCEVLLMSLVMAAVIGSVLMIVKHVGRKYRLPFVPFTLVAYGMVICL